MIQVIRYFMNFNKTINIPNASPTYIKKLVPNINSFCKRIGTDSKIVEVSFSKKHISTYVIKMNDGSALMIPAHKLYQLSFSLGEVGLVDYIMEHLCIIVPKIDYAISNYRDVV